MLLHVIMERNQRRKKKEKKTKKTAKNNNNNNRELNLLQAGELKSKHQAKLELAAYHENLYICQGLSQFA